MANQHRPARTTTNYKIPVSGDDDPGDYVSAWGTTADAVDAALTAAVAQVVAQTDAAAVRARTSSLLTAGV